jgi:hypothetical protein
MPYPNNALNEDVSVSDTRLAFFAIDFNADTFNISGVDGKNIFESACNAVDVHSKNRHFCLVVSVGEPITDGERVKGRKNSSLPESEARRVNKFTAAARDSALSSSMLKG